MVLVLVLKRLTCTNGSYHSSMSSTGIMLTRRILWVILIIGSTVVPQSVSLVTRGAPRYHHQWSSLVTSCAVPPSDSVPLEVGSKQPLPFMLTTVRVSIPRCDDDVIASCNAYPIRIQSKFRQRTVKSFRSWALTVIIPSGTLARTKPPPHRHLANPQLWDWPRW